MLTLLVRGKQQIIKINNEQEADFHNLYISYMYIQVCKTICQSSMFKSSKEHIFLIYFIAVSLYLYYVDKTMTWALFMYLKTREILNLQYGTTYVGKTFLVARQYTKQQNNIKLTISPSESCSASVIKIRLKTTGHQL